MKKTARQKTVEKTEEYKELKTMLMEVLNSDTPNNTEKLRARELELFPNVLDRHAINALFFGIRHKYKYPERY